jgi:hypothetical protein
MTKPKAEAERGIGPFWKVWVCLHGSVVHLASRTEPVVRLRACLGGSRLAGLDLIHDTEHGDTVGFIDWSAVTAVTWRRA